MAVSVGSPRRSSGPSLPSPARRTAASPRSRPLILVAEDEESSRQAVCEVLRDAGYRAHGARDGVELVEQAALLRPDAIVMDLAMPNLNGIEAVAALRQDERTEHTRVIALSASWLAERPELLAEAGFDGALRKPCTGESLLTELSRLLPGNSSGREGPH